MSLFLFPYSLYEMSDEKCAIPLRGSPFLREVFSWTEPSKMGGRCRRCPGTGYRDYLGIFDIFGRIPRLGPADPRRGRTRTRLNRADMGSAPTGVGSQDIKMIRSLLYRDF